MDEEVVPLGHSCQTLAMGSTFCTCMGGTTEGMSGVHFSNTRQTSQLGPLRIAVSTDALSGVLLGD